MSRGFGEAELRRLELLLGEHDGCVREQGRAMAAVNAVDPHHPTIEQATRLASARAACEESRRALLRYVAGTHGLALEEGPGGARLAPLSARKERR